MNSNEFRAWMLWSAFFAAQFALVAAAYEGLVIATSASALAAVLAGRLAVTTFAGEH